jgi:hypothetical protein
MKSLTTVVIGFGVGVGVGIVAVFAGGEAFQWRWYGQPIYQLKHGECEKVEFGLRSDGYVMWRKVMTLTNSPGELPCSPMGWSDYAPMPLWTNRPVVVGEPQN